MFEAPAFTILSLGRIFTAHGTQTWLNDEKKSPKDWLQRLKSLDFPGGSMGKNPSTSSGDMGLIPVLGRFPGKGNGNPLKYSCLGNPMDRGAWQATVHGIAKELDMT